MEALKNQVVEEPADQLVKGMEFSPDKMTMTGHKYGYQVSIGHPQITPYYCRYKEWRGIPVWCPLSDKERREFEAYMLPIIEKWRRRK